MGDLKVSVCMITYNHEKFIVNAIDSILMQQVAFDYKLIISDDCSTDNTRSILKEYQSKFPDKIELLLPQQNLGVKLNFIAALNACAGDYIALCEGDDFWIDPLKLQKQMDFFEQVDLNKKYSICFHDSFIVNEMGAKVQESLLGCIPEDYSVEDVIMGKTIPTQTVMFRSEFLNTNALNISSKSLDSLLFTLLTQKGKARNLTNIGKAAYRIHSGGVWSSLNLKYKFLESLKYQKELYAILDAPIKGVVLQRVYEISKQVDHTTLTKLERMIVKLECVKILLVNYSYGKSFLLLKNVIQSLITSSHNKLVTH